VNKQAGMTLLELLTVMMIISILAMVGLPAYRDYTIRAKVIEDFGLVSEIKLRIAEHHMLYDNLPEKNEQLGLPKDKDINGARLEKLKIDKNPLPGTIKLYYDGDIALPMLGKENEIHFVPEVRNGRLLWDCRGGDMLDRYRPASCRGESKYASKDDDKDDKDDKGKDKGKK
jgi:type IV pilus assembly protein PilA